MGISFLYQKNMKMMLMGLIPITLFSVYLFGWYVLLLLMVSNIAAVITEYLFVRKKKNNKVSMAALVTGSLLALSLPPYLPLWMAAVGAIIAIGFGKMVFGGFGMNIFNPAMVGRTFIYVTFANAMTVQWVEPFTGFPGGFAAFRNIANITSATPMISFGDSGTAPNLFDSFLGFISGSAGETSALILLLVALYLIFTKTAKWQPMVATFLSLLVFNLLFFQSEGIAMLLSGGVMFGTVLIVTDPVTMPKDKTAIWIYGGLIGFLTVFIRKYSLFVGGFMFAVLLTNTFIPIMEYGLKKVKKKG